MPEVASAVSACRTSSAVRLRGTKTPGSTTSRRPQNSTRPSRCSSGSPAIRRSISSLEVAALVGRLAQQPRLVLGEDAARGAQPRDEERRGQAMGAPAAAGASTRRIASSTASMTSSTVTSRPSSADSDVTPASTMPHGHDRAERAEVGVAVEREAVHGHAAGDPYADRGDLALGPAGTARRVGRHPHPAAALDPAGRDAECVAHVDECRLEPAHVGDHVDRVGQGDDRIADQLTGPVPGDLAAAVDVDDRSAVERTLVRLGAASRGVDRRVLQQQQRVRPGALDPRGVQLALERPRLLVGDGPGPHDLQLRHGTSL